MDHLRISELHSLLEKEFQKTPLDHKRIAEINRYLSEEFAIPSEPAPPTPTIWDRIFPLPENWKIYVTSAIGVAVALNSQFHFVAQNIQDSFLAIAIALGFWAVNNTQTKMNMRLRSK